TSNPCAGASTAKRRASPGRAVASTSTSQPPPRRVSRIAVTARASARAAAGFVIRSVRVISVALFPEEVEARLPDHVPRLRLGQGIRADADRLEASLRAPLRANAELEREPERVAQRDGPALAEPRVHDQERLGPELATHGELHARQGVVLPARADLHV